MSWMSDEITRRGGAVPFRDFMELALYDPDHGYYRQGRSPVGRGGDFVTAPAASGWYPRVLAGMTARLARMVGAVTLVDVGSGDGSFLAGVGDALGARAPDVLAGVVSVESAPAMRRRQEERLAGMRVATAWRSAVAELESFPGPTVLHSSELYDALPVHRLVTRGSRLRELWVASAGEELAWEERDPAAEAVSYLESHGVELEDGQIAEVNLGAGDLHRSLLGRLQSGLAVTLDYGYETRRLYDARGRRGGTLTCYRGHRLSRDPLERPGEQDITAHVNWDDLRRVAVAADWEEVGLWPLAEFLVRAGLAHAMERHGVGEDADWDAATLAQRQEIKRLLDPDGMGSDLKVLVQGRGRLLGAARGLLTEVPLSG